MVHLILPMAGRGSRFAEKFNLPKPLIPLRGQPFFYWATRAILAATPVTSLTCVVLREHVERYGLDRRIKEHVPRAGIVALPDVTEGPVITCLKGAETVPHDGAPLIFQDCDHAFACAPLAAELAGAFPAHAGLLLSFDAATPHYSFIRPGADNAVLGTVEKQAVSRHAIAGAYIFRDRATFETNAHRYIDACPYPEPFTSGVYNTMLQRGERVRFLTLDWHIPFGVVSEYEAALQDARLEKLRASSEQPAAVGSRSDAL